MRNIRLFHSLLAGILLVGCLPIHAQQYKVIVHILGHDGKTVTPSHATLAYHEVGTKINIPGRKIDDHTYEFRPNSRGTYTLRVAGLHHRAFSGPVIIDTDSLTALEARLGTLAPEMKTPDSVFISGNFNGFSMQEGILKMTAQKNGSFSALIPAESRSIYYRPLLFINGDGIPVDAPQEKTYAYDSNRFTVWAGGNYYAIKAEARQPVKVTFNPQALLISDLPAVVKFAGPSNSAARLLAAYMDVDFRLMKFRLASYNFLETRQMGDFEDFLRSYDVAQDLEYFFGMSRDATTAEERDVYTVATFHLTPTDSIRAIETLSKLSPLSAVWKIGLNWTRPFLNALSNRKEAAAFAERIAATQSSPGIRSEYLKFALEIYFKEDENSFIRLYNAMMKEFEMWPEFLRDVKQRNPIDRKIAVGNSIPNFSFQSMDDSNRLISPSHLQGRTYLIDLWATWCGPCVAELKNIHRVYEKFSNKGFTVVSISFDASAETVAAFREKKWDMPWHHVFAGDSQEAWKNFGKLFELQGIPRAILVNKDGIIVGLDEQLKGEKLDTLLEAELR